MRHFVAALIAITLVGCATPLPARNIAYFTAASSIKVSSLSYDPRESVRVKGEDCIHRGAISDEARIQRAMDNAIRNGQQKLPDADLLVNVTIENTFPARVEQDPFLPIKVSNAYDCIEVTGELVRLK